MVYRNKAENMPNQVDEDLVLRSKLKPWYKRLFIRPDSKLTIVSTKPLVIADSHGREWMYDSSFMRWLTDVPPFEATIDSNMGHSLNSLYRLCILMRGYED